MRDTKNEKLRQRTGRRSSAVNQSPGKKFVSETHLTTFFGPSIEKIDEKLKTREAIFSQKLSKDRFVLQSDLF